MTFGTTRTWRIVLILIWVALFSATAALAQKAVSEKAPVAQHAGAISGRVLSQGGETMNGAMAFANPIGGLGPPRSTIVDNSGNFKFESLDPGVYFITASLPGFVPAPPTSPAGPRRY